jgi:hypothetical protein
MNWQNNGENQKIECNFDLHNVQNHYHPRRLSVHTDKHLWEITVSHCLNHEMYHQIA